MYVSSIVLFFFFLVLFLVSFFLFLCLFLFYYSSFFNKEAANNVFYSPSLYFFLSLVFCMSSVSLCIYCLLFCLYYSLRLCFVLSIVFRYHCVGVSLYTLSTIAVCSCVCYSSYFLLVSFPTWSALPFCFLLFPFFLCYFFFQCWCCTGSLSLLVTAVVC